MPRNSVFQFRWTILNVAPAMNNNNNNRVPSMHIRDRLFRVIFARLAVSYAVYVPLKFRNAIERILLFFSILSLFSLMYIHIMFIHTHLNCLDSVQGQWPRDGILRVEVIHNRSDKPYTLEDSYRKEAMIRRSQAMDNPYHNLFYLADPKRHSQQKASQKASDQSFSASFPLPEPEIDEAPEDFVNFFQPKMDDEDDDTAATASSTAGGQSRDLPEVELRVSVYPPNKTNSQHKQGVSKRGSRLDRANETCPECLSDTYIVEYALEYGYLKMSEKARRRWKIPVKMVVLDASTDKCFGNRLTRLFLDYVLGYNEALLASVSKLASKEGSKGFIRNVVEDHYFRFVSVMGHSSYAFAAFIMCIFTFSISTLLRYAHHQIFVFIVQLLRMFEFQSSVTVPTAPLLTVVLSLVGMEAIMSEFFSNPTTSFYVIMIVWTADQYDAICCRTTITRRHWLRFFYLYHFAFYAYEYRFSGQYSDFALFTSCCFILHSMVYFFHHYELPVILRFAGRRFGHRQQRMHSPRREPPDQPPDVEPSAEAPIEDSASSSSSAPTNSNGSRTDASDTTSDASSSSSSTPHQDDDDDDEFDEYTPTGSDSSSSSSSVLHSSPSSTASSLRRRRDNVGAATEPRAPIPDGRGPGCNRSSRWRPMVGDSVSSDELCSDCQSRTFPAGEHRQIADGRRTVLVRRSSSGNVSIIFAVRSRASGGGDDGSSTTERDGAALPEQSSSVPAAVNHFSFGLVTCGPDSFHR